MSDGAESRLTQSYLGLADKDFNAIPDLQRTLIDTINRYIDVHHVSMGTAIAALACVVGEYVLLNGAEADKAKNWFVHILDGYVCTGIDGARTGPNDEPSLVRRFMPWAGGTG